jgi:hypothetical protein
MMANFDCQVHQVPGSLNGAADALSRPSDLRETDRPIAHALRLAFPHTLLANF